MSSFEPEPGVSIGAVENYCSMECPVQCDLAIEEFEERAKYAILSIIAKTNILPDDGMLGFITEAAQAAGVPDDLIDEMKTQTRTGTAEALDILDESAQEIDKKREKIAARCGGPLVLQGVANGQLFEVTVCTSTDGYPTDTNHADVHLTRAIEL